MAIAGHLELLSNQNSHEWTINELTSFLKWKYPTPPEGLYLVGIGLSGSLIVGTLSYTTKIPFLIIRKSSDVTHSPYRVEYNGKPTSYIFVDDFIANGWTYKNVKEQMKSMNIKLEGIVFHTDWGKFSINNLLSSKINVDKCWIKSCHYNGGKVYDWYEENFISLTPEVQ